jgi:hypothetical protein
VALLLNIQRTCQPARISTGLLIAASTTTSVLLGARSDARRSEPTEAVEVL